MDEDLKRAFMEFLGAVSQFTWENPSPASQNLSSKAAVLHEKIRNLPGTEK